MKRFLFPCFAWPWACWCLLAFCACGCDNRCDEPGPELLAVQVNWTDGTPCEHAELRWIGAGDLEGPWGAGHAEVILQDWMPASPTGAQTMPTPSSETPLERIEARDASDTSVWVGLSVADPASAGWTLQLPKHVHLDLRPGHAFPPQWIGEPYWVYTDSIGWDLAASGEWQWGGQVHPLRLHKLPAVLYVFTPHPMQGGTAHPLALPAMAAPWPDTLTFSILN